MESDCLASDLYYSFRCFQEIAFVIEIFERIVRPLLAALSVNGLSYCTVSLVTIHYLHVVSLNGRAI